EGVARRREPRERVAGAGQTIPRVDQPEVLRIDPALELVPLERRGHRGAGVLANREGTHQGGAAMVAVDIDEDLPPPAGPPHVEREEGRLALPGHPGARL